MENKSSGVSFINIIVCYYMPIRTMEIIYYNLLQKRFLSLGYTLFFIRILFFGPRLDSYFLADFRLKMFLRIFLVLGNIGELEFPVLKWLWYRIAPKVVDLYHVTLFSYFFLLALPFGIRVQLQYAIHIISNDNEICVFKHAKFYS